MGYFPFFVDLTEKSGLIVGGGTVALRKIEKLLPYGPRLTVAAPAILEDIEHMEGLSLVRRSFAADLLDEKDFVIAATDDRQLNHEIARLCRERRIPVNAVDDKEACSFIFSSLVKKGKLSVGISTEGASPSAAIYLKNQVNQWIPEHFDEILDFLEASREIVKKRIPEEKCRSQFFSRLLEHCMKKGRALNNEEFEQEMKAYAEGRNGQPLRQKPWETVKGQDSEAGGCVYLVGAGCGKADLITVRGLKLLQKCQVLVYDDLIAEELLREVPESAEKIYVGKRSGRHSVPQHEICGILVKKASEGKMVVRLKGGDPFVFGRGGEEILALQKNGIPYDEVPGISSAIAIPAAAGIPVTHRGLSQSFHVITAHTADTSDGLPEYMDMAAQLPGTLVFLMGLSQLSKIAHRLIQAGMDRETPAAVISGGNAPHPAVVRGSLREIASKVQEAHVLPPAVIVVGETAAMDLSPTILRPLEGITVGVTGTEEIQRKQREELERCGANVFCAGGMKVKELPERAGEPDWQQLCSGRPHWIVFTSGNGVRLFFKRLERQKINIRSMYACKFAVIGASTEKVLNSYGVKADLCPEKFTSVDLAEALVRAKETVGEAIDTVYIFRSAKGSKELAKILEKRYCVKDIALYDICKDAGEREGIRQAIASADYLTFSSAGGALAFFAGRDFGGDGDKASARDEMPVSDGASSGGGPSISPETVCVCIGQVTADAVRSRFGGRILVAEETSALGIVEAILKDRMTEHG